MAPPPLYSLTATEVQQKIKDGNLKLEHYVESLLSRYKERDNDVLAWETLRVADVLEQAKQLDQLPPDQRGCLHGFVIGVKDVINTKDLPTKHNSPLYAHAPPLLDASTVDLLRHHGALIFGKTKTTEFAVTAVGPGTKNPHDPSRTPGGSSSGSGAAVADMQVPIGLGTQTIGSIVRPASFNGIYGFKPTWNAISREGQKVTSLTLDTFGFLARSIADMQKLADVFGLQDDETPKFIDLHESTFAMVKTPIWPDAGPGTVAAMDHAAKILRNAGAQVEELTLPPEFDDALSLQMQVLRGEAHVTFYNECTTARDQISDTLAEAASGLSSRRQYLEAFDKLASLRPKLDEIAKRYTAIITPSTPDVAPISNSWTGDPRFNGIWTGLHTPVINIPGFKGEGEMPLGLSLVTARYQDQHLLQVASVVGPLFECHGGWKSKLS